MPTWLVYPEAFAASVFPAVAAAASVLFASAAALVVVVASEPTLVPAFQVVDPIPE